MSANDDARKGYRRIGRSASKERFKASDDAGLGEYVSERLDRETDTRRGSRDDLYKRIGYMSSKSLM